MSTHGGSPNGEYEPPPATPGSSIITTNGISRKAKPEFEKINTISYVANGADSNLILSIGRSATSTTTPSADPRAVVLTNTGTIPVVVMVGYEAYVTETADVYVDTTAVYVHSLLMPGETLQPNMRSIINLKSSGDVSATTEDFADESLHLLDGTVVDWTAPGTTLKQDSGADVKNNTLNNTTDPVTFEVGLATHSKLFRVGDCIRIGDEILEILGTYEDDPTNSSLVAGNIRCKRGQYGSDSASHSGTPDIYFPYFNKHHEFDKYASAGYVQTNERGEYYATNFFGLGRNDSTAPMGIVPGSACFRFNSQGYQELGLQNISSATNTGLAAGTLYGFDLTVNGSGLLNSDTMQFTTDTSNVNFGGVGGVISKIQEVLNAQYYDEGSSIFLEKVTVEIINGDIRFTSASHLTTSAIALAAPSEGETTPFGVGRFPAIGSIKKAVPAMVPEGIDLVSYDPITYVKTVKGNVLAYDRGDGTIAGACTGSINYETGKFFLRNAPPNANFEYSVIHSSPFAGKVDSSETARALGLVAVHANVLNRQMSGRLKLQLY